MMCDTTYKRLSPICFLPSGKLVCYRYGKLIIMQDGNIEKTHQLFTSKRETLLGRSKLAYRLLRLGIRTSIALDENHIIISVGDMLYEFDLRTGQCSEGYYCGEGIRPLMMTDIKGVSGFDDGIYFGGYLRNPDKNEVSIYKRVDVDKWDIVHTFPQGVINHVHTILCDNYRNCVWVFTGDFDESAAIWKATDNFKTVERTVCNDQKYRGCVAFALPEGLLYATDAPFADNFIYLMNPDNNEVKKISPLDGSCIYGCQWKDNYVFSTTVEADGRDESLMKLLFSRKLGAGIKDRYVKLVAGNLSNGFNEIYRDKKDWLPFIFQFGVIKFPNGLNSSDTLLFQPVATTKNDLNLISIKENICQED